MDILSRQTDLSICHISLSTVLKGNHAIKEAIDACLKKHSDILVCDAATIEDMREIALAAMVFPDLLWVGSAGLAEQLAKMRKPNERSLLQKREDKTLCPSLRNRGRAACKCCLVIAGSKTKTTRKQVDHFALRDDVASIKLNPYLLCQDHHVNRYVNESAQTVINALLQEKHVIVSLEDSPVLVQQIESLKQTYSLTNTDIGTRICFALGEITRHVSAATSLAGLVMTGGDVAQAVCKALQVDAIEIVEEIETGVPKGILIGANIDPLSAVTKAGAFGSLDVFSKAVDRLSININ
jgi:uncharacterized protein YgbK (DUF1537 family)